MPSIEIGYHKLSDPNDWPSIEENGFNPSVPAERHWLGEGIYFFLEPNGLLWATKWPFKAPRKDSIEGIVVAEIDISDCLDFRDVKLFSIFRTCVNQVRGAISRSGKQYSDGRAIAQIFKLGLIKKPKCIVANFDSAIDEAALWYESRFVLKPTYCFPPYSETTQIQACVTDHSVISNLSLYQPYSAL